MHVREMGIKSVRHVCVLNWGPLLRRRLLLPQHHIHHPHLESLLTKKHASCLSHLESWLFKHHTKGSFCILLFLNWELVQTGNELPISVLWAAVITTEPTSTTDYVNHLCLISFCFREKQSSARFIFPEEWDVLARFLCSMIILESSFLFSKLFVLDT